MADSFVVLESGIESVVLVVDCVECVLQSLRFDNSRTPLYIQLDFEIVSSISTLEGKISDSVLEHSLSALT
jgi:hypothetical protein